MGVRRRGGILQSLPQDRIYFSMSGSLDIIIIISTAVALVIPRPLVLGAVKTNIQRQDLFHRDHSLGFVGFFISDVMEPAKRGRRCDHKNEGQNKI